MGDNVLIMLVDDWKTSASDIPEGCSNGVCIKKKKVDKGTLWSMKEDERGVFGYDKVLFTESTTITGLEEWMEDEWQVWMTDSPREYYSMWELVARTKPGKVLVGGLGLGVLANLLSLRNDIDDITVVEISESVIDLVGDYVNPKVKIINDDIFKVVSELASEGNCPDTIILDIYKGTEDVDDVAIDIESIKDYCSTSNVIAWKFTPEIETNEALSCLAKGV